MCLNFAFSSMRLKQPPSTPPPPPPPRLPLGFILTSFSKCIHVKRFYVIIKLSVFSSQEKVDQLRNFNHTRFEPSFENAKAVVRKTSKATKKRRAELAFQNWSPKCYFRKVMYRDGLYLLLIVCLFFFLVVRIKRG